MIDSKENEKLMFHTPDGRSYLCADVGTISLFAQMNWDYDKAAPHDVQNTTVHATNVQFDAFRNLPPVPPGIGFRVIKNIFDNGSYFRYYMAKLIIDRL